MRALAPMLIPTALLGANAFAAPSDLSTSSGLDSDSIRAIVAEMLNDAETRSSLLQGGSTAGHDGKFFLASPSGDFRLNVSGQVQVRYMLNFRDDENGTVDDFASGFSLPRVALRFDGAIYDDIVYAIQGVFNSSGGGFTLEDAYAGYVFDNGLIILGGQYREPILWEDVLQEKYSLAVDQSVVNAVFSQGYSQGIWAHYSADSWRMWAGFDSGIRSANTDFNADPAEWGVTTRWEWKFAGNWSQFDQFSSPRGAEFAAKLGGGVHFEQSPHAPGTVETDLLAYTADIMVEGNGWNVFGMGVGLYTDTNGGGGSFNDLGFLVQGGVFVTDDIEPFARYDVVIPDSDRAADQAFNTITAGANYYLHGQAAKFTLDVQYFLDDTAGNALVSGIATGVPGSVGNQIGLLPTMDDGEFVIRLQFQLLF